MTFDPAPFKFRSPLEGSRQVIACTIVGEREREKGLTQGFVMDSSLLVGQQEAVALFCLEAQVRRAV